VGQGKIMDHDCAHDEPVRLHVIGQVSYGEQRNVPSGHTCCETSSVPGEGLPFGQEGEKVSSKFNPAPGHGY